MSKAVMLSIQPKWCELIASGCKTIEVRKTMPKIPTPFKCYIYMTKTKERCRFWEYITAYQNSKGEILDGSQKVIGEFVCDRIDTYHHGNMDYPIPVFDGDDSICEIGDGYYITSGELEKTCLTYEELEKYGKDKTLYGLHISDLVIYDKPRELGEFYKVGKHAACAKGERTCDRLRYTDFCRTCKFEIRRPPQSWQYIDA